MINRLRERLAASVTRDDGTRLLASFVLATMLWGWVSLVTDPEVTRLFPNYTLSFEAIQGDLRLVTNLPPVTVRLTGPESVIDDVSADEVTVSIETSSIDEPGTYTLPVRVEAPDGVRKEQATPDRVSVEVERIKTENFPVVPEVVGLGEGDPRQVGQPVPEVSEVTIRGPESDVDRVERVELRIEIGEHSRDFTAEFPPVALDVQGNPVAEVEISPERIPVRVPVSQRGRSVAVLASVQGTPAEGYEVVDRRINPPNVQVDGPPEVLATSITVLTEPVDVTGATQNVSERVPLDMESLPEGVRVIQPADGMVEVVVQIAQRGVIQTLPDQIVLPIGLGPNLAVSVEPEAVTVTVVATESQLQTLEADDIAITVELAGLGPGTYELTPGVSVPANMRWVRMEPRRVTVTIAAAGTPVGTATGSPAASPIATPTGEVAALSAVGIRRRGGPGH